jgi:hypothetical protein
MDDVRRQLPVSGTRARRGLPLRFSYPRDWERLLDEGVIREHFAEAFELKLVKHHQHSQRSRLGDHVAVEAMAPEDLLVLHWRDLGLDDEIGILRELARDVFGSVEVDGNGGG